MESQVVESIIYRDKEPCWKTKEGELIPVSEMPDSHLRNTALFLMGFGYQNCIADDRVRVAWLAVLRREWARRSQYATFKKQR
jgi:hypothetical protein